MYLCMYVCKHIKQCARGLLFWTIICGASFTVTWLHPLPLPPRFLQQEVQNRVRSSSSTEMLALVHRLLDWFRSLFWKEEMELTLVGLQYSGKTTFVNVIAVSLLFLTVWTLLSLPAGVENRCFKTGLCEQCALMSLGVICFPWVSWRLACIWNMNNYYL